MEKNSNYTKFLNVVKNSEITKLTQSLDLDQERWIEYSMRALPDTIRVNPIHKEHKWTISKIEDLGGKRIEWVGEKTLGYQMPWEKGNIDDIKTKKLLQSMHNSGRHTGQEAVSMIPAELINPFPNETIFDACAAPGSKTTQLAELSQDEAAIIANEPNKGRMNMLVTNRSRLGLKSIAITQHDARNFPRISKPGFDAILIDVPCSGTGTIRKNKKLWWKWKPSISESLHKLQLKISKRCSQLLKPGGRLIYSTCSIDPLENEIIVAEILEEYDWLELEKIDVGKVLPNLNYQKGIHDFSSIFENQRYKNFSIEESISQLENCIRIYPEQNNSGGFFIAMFKQVGDGENAVGLNEKEFWPIGNKPVDKNDHGAPIPLKKIRKNELENEWGELRGYDGKFWQRGRSIIETSRALSKSFYDPERYDSSGYKYPGKHWHPLKVRQVGRILFKDTNSHALRPKSELFRGVAIPPKKHIFKVKRQLIFTLLDNGIIPIEELEQDFKKERKGALILDVDWIEGRRLLPAWIGTSLRLLLDENEKFILQTQRNDYYE